MILDHHQLVKEEKNLTKNLKNHKDQFPYKENKKKEKIKEVIIYFFIYFPIEVVKDDDGFFSNLFVKWKANPVFGKK